MPRTITTLICASALVGGVAAAPREMAAPAYFEPNRGQAGRAVAAFVGRGSNYTILLQPDGGAVYRLSSGTVRLDLAGANQASHTGGEQPLPSVTHYYGASYTHEARTVPHYGSVRARGVYPGVDMLWRSRGPDVEYEFAVDAGADPRRIQLRFSGARSMRIDRGGNLVLETGDGRLCHRRPVAWQEIAGRRVEVDARFRLNGAGAGATFQLGRYDHRQALWIDPVLSYSSYVGGAGFDAGYAIAVDTSGNTYVTGTTASVGFPSYGPLVSSYRDAFVTKFNASGSMVYTTILSGTGDTYGQAIAIDSAGNAYVAGYTEASDFPATPGAWQRVSGGGTDAFIAKLAPGGSVLYATYAGGSGSDYATGIAVDGSGNAYVSGYTASMNFPTTIGAAQPVYRGGAFDAFVIKLNAAGSAAFYATLLGGSGTDIARAIALDPAGNVCIAGYTDSTDLPVVAALQSNPAGEGDALIACLNATGTAWTTVSYLGGIGMDDAYALVRDATGNLYVAGTTFSVDFPTTPTAFQTAPAGSYDAFVVKLNPGAVSVAYATLLGGTGSDAATALALSSAGDVWLAGYTTSFDFPLVSAWQSFNHGGFDGFVAHLSADGSALLASSYLGGAGDDQIWDIAAGSEGQLFITGATGSTDFPITPGAAQPTAPGGVNAFLAQINPLLTGYSISGQATVSGDVPLGGVTITLSGAASGSTKTDASGNYGFTGLLAGGTYTITPSGAGYNFNPSVQTFTSMGANQTANFTAARAPAQLVSDWMSESTPTGSGCTAPPVATGFLTTDSQAVVWFQVNGAIMGDLVTANWYSPTGSLYTSYSWSPVSSPGSTCFWTSINIAGNPPASQPGAWSVQAYWNGATLLTLSFTIQAPGSALLFVPVTPCRVVDTRSAPGPFGGPKLANNSRDFAIPNGACGIPATAQAYSLNVTVVPAGPLGYLTIWAAGQPQPVTSTLNSLDGRIKANAAIVPTGQGGAVSVYASAATDVVLDINGYFVSGNVAGLAFYPVMPCRVVDTRNAPGALGGPIMAGNQTRSFPLPSGGCGIPASAQAYSLNFTGVPSGPLGYLTTWPAGGTQPVVSTLNAPTGLVTANAAFVPAGSSGAIEVYVSAKTHVVIDINGYFAPVASGGLSFYGVSPCRAVDTRNAAGPLGGPVLSGQRDFPISTSTCGLPSTAQAYSLNATVVPQVALGYLTLWATGAPQPVVSTLNSPDGSIVSNAAIVPTLNGSISAYASALTQLILDANGYFAP